MSIKRNDLSCYLYYKYGMTPKEKSYDLLSVLDPNTNSQLLNTLSGSEEDVVRCVIADHPKTLPETLDELANDIIIWVRFLVCKNVNTNTNTLERLKTTKNCQGFIARHKNCSISTLAELATEFPQTVVNNINTDKKTLEFVYKNNSDQNTLIAIASHPNVSDQLLKLLAKNENPHVRSQILYNKNVTTQLAELLTKDSVSWVKSRALDVLQKLQTAL